MAKVSWVKAKHERASQVGWRCELCKVALTHRTAIGHHRIPRSVGGKNTTDNLELRCRECEALDPHTKAKRGGRRKKKRPKRGYVVQRHN